MKISDIFLAAVCATIISCPSLFIAVCKVSEPIFISELIKPIDMPALSIFLSICLSASDLSPMKSSVFTLSTSYFFTIYIQHMIKAMVCASTVASAAPRTPILTTTTKNISPTIFKQTDTSNMIRGVSVSPSALSAAAQASYKNVASSPAIITKIYDMAVSISVSDTFKNTSICLKNTRQTIVIASAIVHPSLRDMAKDFLTPS